LALERSPCRARGAGIERNDSAHNIKPSPQSLPLTQPVPRSERSMGSVWPQFVEMGIVAEEAIPAATLATKVRSAVVEAGSQIECPAQVCAWARI
jgi:hypothetical protein